MRKRSTAARPRRITVVFAPATWGSRRRPTTSVWLPSQNGYREISSCSNCGIQARRASIKFRAEGTGRRTRPRSTDPGLRLGERDRDLENYQKDARSEIPEALRRSWAGRAAIGRGGWREGRVRTPGTVRVRRFQDRRYRPLSHLSALLILPACPSPRMKCADPAFCTACHSNRMRPHFN